MKTCYISTTVLSIPAFLITFTDGLEAFLVIAAAVAFLRKTRRHALASAVYWGIAVSVVTSLAGAWLFSRSDNQPAWEGRLALVAAAGVAGLAVYMWRLRHLLREDALESQRRAGRHAGLAFFVFTVLVVSRVGMHMVLLIGTFLFQIRVPALTMGIMAGLALAALIAWLWARYGHLLRLSVFVPVTVIVLAVAMAELVSDAVQNLANATAPPPIVERIPVPLGDTAGGALFLNHGKAPCGRVAHVDQRPLLHRVERHTDNGAGRQQPGRTVAGADAGLCYCGMHGHGRGRHRAQGPSPDPRARGGVSGRAGSNAAAPIHERHAGLHRAG